MNKNSSIGTLTSLTNQEGFKTVSIASVVRISNIDEETLLGTSRILEPPNQRKLISKFKIQRNLNNNIRWGDILRRRLDCRNFKEFQNPEECNSYVLLTSGAVWIGAMNLTVPLEKHASLCKTQKQKHPPQPKSFRGWPRWTRVWKRKQR